MKPRDNENYPQTLTVDPLHTMEDDELVSRVTITYKEMMDNSTPSNADRFREVRRELLYRLRKSHLESWTPPKRLTAPTTTGGQE